MPDIVAVVIENPEQPIKAILAPGTGEVAAAIISQIGPDGLSGYSGFSGASGFSGFSGKSGFSGFSGFSGDPAQQSGYSGYSGKSGYSGFCGLSGFSGFSGTSGFSGYSGFSGSGTSGFSGFSGFCGLSGYSGFCGLSGYSGFSSISGYSGFCGLSGYSGFSGSGISGYSGYSGAGLSGYSGFSGLSGYSGFCGLSGYSGFCGISGYSGFSASGISGYSGYSGAGLSGFSGYSGFCGLSGYSGFSGPSGYSGFCGLSGYSGFCGLSGYSGFSGKSGYSGFSGDPAQQSGYSGYCGLSGYSGYSGSGISGYSGYSGAIGFAGSAPYWPQDTASDIGTYNDILTTPESGTEATASAVCNNNQVLIQAYATPSAGLGLTLIPSGEWTFDFYASVTSLSLASDLVLKFYSRTSGGSETLLFTTTSPTLTSTSLTEYEWSTIQPEFAINATDRLVVKIYGETAIPLNTTVAFTYLGQTHYSRIISSFTPVGISGFSGYSGFSGKSGYSGFSSTSGYSGFCGISGYSGFCGLSGYSGFSGYSGVSGYSGPAISKISYTQNVDLGLVVNPVVTKSGTITGTAGVGSSLFLARLMVPAQMTLTEIQCAMSIGFPATNQGAGTLSRSMVIYSLGNSTSLASVLSASGTSSWNTGTITAGASTSLTQFQGGWSVPLIQPMTLASSALAPGEYVIGQLFNFAQASSTWTLALYGDIAASTFLASAATNLTSASLGAMSSGNLFAASAFTALSFTAGRVITVALSTLGLGKVGSTASLSAAAASSIMATATANSTVSLLLSAANVLGNVVFSDGLSAGSFFTASGSLGAVTNVALGALNSSTLAQLTQPNFGFIGTGSTTSGFPTAFLAGIMSTGAIPTAITLTSAAVTYSGSFAFQQPWFALVGS